MKLRGFIFVMFLMVGMAMPKNIDAEIIKNLDFFENLDLLEDDQFEIEEEEDDNEKN